MVLKEKEDLCNWFKVLHPRKRIDYMCGLLHLCLPLELRFIGTVLEDIAKKDFNYLRDAENKANTPIDLKSDGSQSFADRQFRAKIHVNLALMHSADGSCADIIFGILEREFNSLTNYFHDKQVLEEILTILTLACHHPAFKIHQRLRLGEVLKNTEDHCNLQWDNPSFPKNFQGCPSVPTSCRLPKGIISIVVNAIRDEHQNKKWPEYQIHTTWSNGDITQHCKKYKELQNLHHQIFNKFPEEKKIQSLFPPVSGQRRYRQENRDEKLSSMNLYFSELSKAQHILACDTLTRAFENGKPIQMPLLYQPHVYYPPYMHDNRYYGHYPDGLRIPYFPQPNALNMVAMPPTPGMSSSTTSPSNSRSSSPNITINSNKNVKPPDTGAISSADNKGVSHNKPKSGLQQQQPQAVVVDTESPPQIETCQLLKLLDLEKYSNVLASHSLQEVYSMTSEELAKLGVPPEAQMKLQSRLDQQKNNLQDMNGLIQLQGTISKQQEQAMHSFPNLQGQGHMPQSDPTQQTPPLPSLPYPPIHPILISPQTAIQSLPSLAAVDNSLSASDQCTPSLSPGLNSMTDSPTSSLASPTSVYLEEKNHQVDSSGSDDDKNMGSFEGTEATAYRPRDPGRPQQSMSLTLLNRNTSSPSSTEKGKVTVVPASLSAPLMNSEATRDAGTPPMIPVNVTMVNGFVTESSYMPPNFVMSYSPLHHQPQQQQRYKSAQPTHTGTRIHKVVNMPCVDVTQQPPPASSINMTNSGGGGMNSMIHQAMLHHSHHSYIIQPTNSSIHHHHPSQQPTNGSVAPPQQLPPTGQALLPPPMATDNGGSIATIPFMPAIVPAPHNFLPPHSRTVVMTTMSSNSTGVISTSTPNHHLPSGQQQPLSTAAAGASHSPSPVASSSSSVQSDQAQIGYIHPNTNGDGLDGRHEEVTHSHNHNTSKTINPPPGHNSSNNSTPMSHISSIALGPGSGTPTPSPPLPLPPPKQMVTTCMSGDSPNHHQTVFVPPPLYMIPNIAGNNISAVTMPPYSNPNHQQNSLQQHFPNGIAPEVYHLQAARFQLQMGSAGQLPPFYYGSQAFNPNPHIHQNNNGNPSHHTSGNNGSVGGNNNNTGGKPGGKNSCYNCGSSGHKANECKENPMDSITNSFRLNIKPKSSDSE